MRSVTEPQSFETFHIHKKTGCPVVSSSSNDYRLISHEHVSCSQCSHLHIEALRNLLSRQQTLVADHDVALVVKVCACDVDLLRLVCQLLVAPAGDEQDASRHYS